MGAPLMPPQPSQPSQLPTAQVQQQPRPVAAPVPVVRPSPPPQCPGSAPAPNSLSTGQLVFAEYSGGWYLADVLRSKGDRCDVAWRRPNGEQWGCKEAMLQYLCSTGADETCHGEQLQIATQIRLPQASSSAAPSGPPAKPPSQGIANNDLLDLLG